MTYCITWLVTWSLRLSSYCLSQTVRLVFYIWEYTRLNRWETKRSWKTWCEGQSGLSLLYGGNKLKTTFYFHFWEITHQNVVWFSSDAVRPAGEKTETEKSTILKWIHLPSTPTAFFIFNRMQAFYVPVQVHYTYSQFNLVCKCNFRFKCNKLLFRK